jgi:hypothetical protein
MRLLLIAAIILSIPDCLMAQKANDFNGLDMNLGNLFRLSNAKTRSISPENSW